MSRKPDESYHLPQPDLPTIIAAQSLSLRAFNRAEQAVNESFSRLTGDLNHSLYDHGGLLNEQALEYLLEEPFPDIPVSGPLNQEAIIVDGLSEELSIERKPLHRRSETQVPVAGDESMDDFGRVDKGRNLKATSTELKNRSELKLLNLVEQLQNTSDTVRSENAGNKTLAGNSHKPRSAQKCSDAFANMQTISAQAATKILEEKWGQSALNRAWSSPLRVDQSNSQSVEITEEKIQVESKLSTNSIQDTEQKLKQKIELLLQNNTAEQKSLHEGGSTNKHSSTEKNGNRNPRHGFQTLSELLKKQCFSKTASERQAVSESTLNSSRELLSPAQAGMPGSLSSKQGKKKNLSGAKEEPDFLTGISDPNNEQISSGKVFNPRQRASEKASGLVGLRGLASRAAENNTIASTSGLNQAGSVSSASTIHNAPTTEKSQQPLNPIPSNKALSVSELAEMIAQEARRSGINLEQFQP